VPLSEHEQRILAELEDSLARHDPRFAERVKSETVYRHSGRHLKWAGAGFVAGVVILVAFYSQSLLLGIAGVVIMFVSAVVFERNLRRVGKAGWHDLRQSLHDERPPGAASGIDSAVHNTRDWFRSHLFRRES
jgi:hypothetical protein